MAVISLMPSNLPPTDPEQERLHLLFKQARSTSIVAAAAAAACTVVISQYAHGIGPWVWLGSILLITVLRLALYNRYFSTQGGGLPVNTWLVRHALAAVPIGIAAGSLPLIDLDGAPLYIQEMKTLIPALVVMAAITSFGVYFKQYLVLLITTIVTVVTTRLWTEGRAAIPMVVMLSMFAPILALTAKRYASSITRTMFAKHRSEQLLQASTEANSELEQRNRKLAQQQDLIEQEEQLAKHVFEQLTLSGDHELRGIHAWNQSMGSLSGDLTQTARGPDGQAYVFLGDFTGHGLPAALGALPASSVFLAMAAKGLPVETIAIELNRKLHQLLPVGYFCCAVLLELSADRRTLHVWNAGLPPILIRRRGAPGYEKVKSHSVPLGVLGDDQFETAAQHCQLGDGDLVYAYSDGLTEAENLDGEMWGLERLERFLLRDDLAAPKLPALIETVLEHVNLAPASDDISVVELEATPLGEREVDAA